MHRRRVNIARQTRRQLDARQIFDHATTSKVQAKNRKTHSFAQEVAAQPGDASAGAEAG
jgi:hypothetical protein